MSLLRDRASAKMLCFPPRCTTWSSNWYVAARKARHLNRFTACVFLDVLLLIIATTAELSHLASTDFPVQWSLHTIAAMTIGANSFTVVAAHKCIGPW